MSFTFTEMPLEDGPMTLTGEVTELEPPHRFAFLWGDDHLHFQLEETDGGAGCLMRFSVELDSRDKAARDGAGWHQCLDALARQLAGAGRASPTTPTRGGATTRSTNAAVSPRAPRCPPTTCENRGARGTVAVII